MTQDQFDTIMQQLRIIRRSLRRKTPKSYQRGSMIAKQAVKYLTSGASGFSNHASRKELRDALITAGFARRSVYRFIRMAADKQVPGFRAFEHDPDRIAYGD